MFRRALPVLALTLGLVGACSASPDTSGPLPRGTDLTGSAAEALKNLNGTRFRLGLSGMIPGLPIRSIEGTANRDGTGSGRADVQESAEKFSDVTYTVAGRVATVSGKNAPPRTLAVPAQYDPATLLGPDKGLRRALLAATGVTTEAKEPLNKVDAYRLTGKLAGPVISQLIPGITADVDVKFWVREAEPHDLMRIWMQVPPYKPSEGAVMLELSLSP
ncbi:LppX_LprAFG lipoprotein [Amycolatopsis sp. CA-230715]|uniref:LppX_LprAFG lipoprotein n=1 Tax=Amycolatopsis sp. CA-230715 TaxID=2745196 RepID=UPI001C0293E0|nr:LppX_LprAFG lipoprotein [Amycolatopsis sp. CA-230715]QWF79063.1 Lipoarabinomannan carrier protein LprG [Amycolatopsis sp. CA-230715]